MNKFSMPAPDTAAPSVIEWIPYHVRRARRLAYTRAVAEGLLLGLSIQNAIDFDVFRATRSAVMNWSDEWRNAAKHRLEQSARHQTFINPPRP